ncbi:MAG: hypothetical protein O2909_05130 [Chloroflexi bacterium]|nr:hypothetical protein [Chloroflexota bacterium]MDA1218807.1 hypothetical protein [Chloroflexota bacterium]PKB57758.1 MAG: hypothetical protein BZY73_01590 [SAR202 cluster bacterium Casp-Chloro-G3]
MATQEMHAQMGGAVAGSEELIPAGAVTFGLMYRTGVGEKNDEGICIHVYGNDIPGNDKELLRLDCFKYDPHYHYRNATIKKNDRIFLDYTAEGGPIPWALDKIKNRLPVMLLRCEAPEVARKLDQRDVDAALPKIVAWAESKTRESYQ